MEGGFTDKHDDDNYVVAILPPSQSVRHVAASLTLFEQYYRPYNSQYYSYLFILTLVS